MTGVRAEAEMCMPGHEERERERKKGAWFEKSYKIPKFTEFDANFCSWKSHDSFILFYNFSHFICYLAPWQVPTCDKCIYIYMYFQSSTITVVNATFKNAYYYLTVNWSFNFYRKWPTYVYSLNAINIQDWVTKSITWVRDKKG